MTTNPSAPTLSNATEKEIFAELESRFANFIFIGHTIRDGKTGWGRWRAGDPVILFGLLHAVEVEMRLEFLHAAPAYQDVNQATPTEAPTDE